VAEDFLKSFAKITLELPLGNREFIYAKVL